MHRMPYLCRYFFRRAALKLVALLRKETCNSFQCIKHSYHTSYHYQYTKFPYLCQYIIHCSILMSVCHSLQYIYVSISLCIYTYIHTYAYIHTYTYIHIYANTHTLIIYVPKDEVQLCIMVLSTSVHTHIYIHKYMHVYAYIYTHTHTHTMCIPADEGQFCIMVIYICAYTYIHT